MIGQTKEDPYKIPRKCEETLEKLRLEKHKVVLLEDTDPSKILHLLSIFTHRSSAGIEKQLNKYFMRELSAKNAFITTFINDEAQIRVIGGKKLKYFYRIPLGHGIVEELFQRSLSRKNEPLGTLHPEIHRCFEELLEGQEGQIVSIPIFTPQGSEIKFLLLSLLDPKEDLFHVIKFAYETFRFCLPTLLQTITNDLICLDRKIHETILKILRSVYLCFNNIYEVIEIILMEVIELTHSTDGYLYMIPNFENDMKCKVFTRIIDKIKRLDLQHYDGIAGRTARTGLSIIIKRNEPELLEENPDLKPVKCMFSFPIFYKEKVICVIVLYNKRSGDYMLQDCDIAQKLNNYCGEILGKCILYDRLKRTEEQSQFSYSMLTNYIKFTDASTQQMLSCPHDLVELDSLDLDPTNILLADTATFAMRIFESLNVLNRFKIDRNKFAKFILHVKFAFNDLPYHNWSLGFRTLHFAYVVVSSMKLIARKIISEFEVFVMLITCLTNNLDFRGPLNAFKLQLGASLDNMFISPGHVVEIHSFCQLINILGLNECNFLENFDTKLYVNTLEMINKYIIIADIVKNPYLRNEPTTPYPCIFSIKPVPTRLKFTLIASIMHLATLCDFIRDFKSSLRAFKLIHQEIHQTNGYSLLPHNDLPSEIRFFTIPQLHKDFYKRIIRPSLLVLTDLLPDLSDFLDNLHTITVCWKYSIQVFKEQSVSELEVLNKEDFLDEVLTIVIGCDEHSEMDEEIPSYEEEIVEEQKEDEFDDDDDDSDDEDKELLAALDQGSVDSMFRIF